MAVSAVRSVEKQLIQRLQVPTVLLGATAVQVQSQAGSCSLTAHVGILTPGIGHCK